MAARYLGGELIRVTREIPVTITQTRPVFEIGPEVIELAEDDAQSGGALHMALVDQVIGWSFSVEPNTPNTAFISPDGYAAAATGVHTTSRHETAPMAELLRASLPRLREVAATHYVVHAIADSPTTQMASLMFRNIHTMLSSVGKKAATASGSRKRGAEFVKVGARPSGGV